VELKNSFLDKNEIDVESERTLVDTLKTRKWLFLPNFCELSDELIPANANQAISSTFSTAESYVPLVIALAEGGFVHLAELLVDFFPMREDKGMGTIARDMTASSCLLSSSSDRTLMEIPAADCFAVGVSETLRRVYSSVRDQILGKIKNANGGSFLKARALGGGIRTILLPTPLLPSPPPPPTRRRSPSIKAAPNMGYERVIFSNVIEGGMAMCGRIQLQKRV